MALATRKRSKSSLNQQTVGHAISFLQDLPEKPKEDLSLKEAVEQMHEPIKAALAKGYSYDDIAKMLSDKGIKISALTLKNYAPSGRRQSSKTKARRGRRAAGDVAATQAVDTAETNNSTTVDTPAGDDSAPAKPRRGRGRSAAKANSETETTVKPTRTRRSSAKTGTRAATPRRRQAKVAE